MHIHLHKWLNMHKRLLVASRKCPNWKFYKVWTRFSGVSVRLSEIFRGRIPETVEKRRESQCMNILAVKKRVQKRIFYQIGQFLQRSYLGFAAPFIHWLIALVWVIVSAPWLRQNKARLYPAREDWRQWIQNFPVSGIGFRKKFRFSPVSQKMKPQPYKFCIHLRKIGLSGYKIDLVDGDRTRTGAVSKGCPVRVRISFTYFPIQGGASFPYRASSLMIAELHQFCAFQLFHKAIV